MSSSASRSWLYVATSVLLSLPGAGVLAAHPAAQFDSSPFREGKLFKGSVSYRVSKGESQMLSGNFEKAEIAFRADVARDARDVRARAGLGFALAK